jgi:hypothetical protein
MKRAIILISVAILSIASAAEAQNAPKEQPKAPVSGIVEGAFPPQRINAEIEDAAKKRTDPNPAARGRFLKIFYAGNASEFAALQHYSIMLLTAISQKQEELPVKRVYIKTGGQEVPLKQIMSWRSAVGTETLAHKVYGPYREDAYYLIPTGLMLRNGDILFDYAANATNIGILRLPSAAAPDATKTFGNLDPAANSKPDLKVLQAFIGRWFPGFPVPQSVP